MVSLIDPIAESALSPRRSSQGLSALNAYQQAESSVLDGADRFMRDRANYRAGQAMTRGDRKAAAAEYYGAGMLPEGSGVEAYDRNLAAADEDRAAARQAADTKRQNELIKERASLLSQVAQGLKTVPAGQRKQQLDAISPIFQKVGLDTSMFSQLTENDLSDASLDTFTGAVAREVEFIKGSDGSYTAADTRTGLPMYQYQAPRQDEFKEVDPKKDLFRIPGSAGSGAAGGAPRNQRNNNPGNIEDGPFARSLPGYVGSDGRFAIFDSPEAGKVAQERLLGSYGARGIDTVAKVINRWAPPSDNNPTDAYVAFVAQRLGVDPNQSLDLRDRSVARKFADAIEAFEGGGQSRSNGPEVVRAAVGASEEAPPAGAGLTDLGGGFYRDKVGRTYQRNSAGVMQQSVGVTDGAVKDAATSITGINTILAAVDRFDQAVKQLKPTEFSALGKYTGDPNKYAAAKAAATDLQMLLKGPDAYNLGVLTGPDLQILEGVVADPAKFDTMIRRGQILPSLQQLSTGLGQKYAGVKKSFEVMGGAPSALPDIYRSPHGRFGRGGASEGVAQGNSDALPAAARAQLKAGQVTTFANGQRWTLRDGKPQRVK